MYVRSIGKPKEVQTLRFVRRVNLTRLTTGGILQKDAYQQRDENVPSNKPLQVEELAHKLLQNDSATHEFIRCLLENLGPEGQQWVNDRILRPTPASQGNMAFANLISARQVGALEQQAMELAALINFFNYRKNLLSGSIPATKAAEMLGVSRTTIHERIRSGQLLGIVDNNVMKMPTWQFDAQGPNGAVHGLAEVLEALSCNVLAKISWLSSSNAIFGNQRPIDALKNGHLEEVIHEARAVEVA